MTDEKQAQLQVLDETLHDQLHHYYTEVQKIHGDSMMYDETGDVAFVTIAFCHPNNPDVFPDDADSNDKIVAIGSASSAIMPDVQANEFGQIGEAETVKHGVQAVAAALLLSSVQCAMVAVMKHSQGTILKHRKMN